MMPTLLQCPLTVTNALECITAYRINPYGLWVLALHHVFEDAVEHADLIGPEGAHFATMAKEEGQQRTGGKSGPIGRSTTGSIAANKGSLGASSSAAQQQGGGGLRAAIAAANATAARATAPASEKEDDEEVVPIELGKDLAPPGSVEDAIRFFDSKSVASHCLLFSPLFSSVMHFTSN
jgi:hypothetical protein